MAAALLEAGADACAADVNGLTAVHVAAQHAPVSVLRALLAAGGSATAAQADGATPLHWAALAPCGAAARVAMLVAAGAAVNAAIGAPRRAGETPLHAAAESGSIEAVQSLLERGALVDARANVDGLTNATPLHAAAARPSEEAIVRHLLRAGADVRATATVVPVRDPRARWGEVDRGGAGYSCLHITSSVVVARTLIKAGADVRAVAPGPNEGFTCYKVRRVCEDARREALAATPPVGVAVVLLSSCVRAAARGTASS